MIKRTISWIVMLIVLIPVILYGGIVFNIAVALISLFALKELMDLRKKRPIPPFMQFLAYYFVLVMIGINLAGAPVELSLNYPLLVAIALAFFLPLVAYYNKKKYEMQDATYLIGIVLLIGVVGALFVYLRDIRMAYIIYVLLIAVSTDTFAYAGVWIGKNKLTKISPKKSWEGTIYGVFMATVIGSLFFVNVVNPDINLLTIVILTFVISASAVIGDLVFSVIKREYNVKDFGNIIPGHGGILDRIDSIIFALLTFSLILPFL